MLNKYPLWKNLLILVLIGIGFIYALPNLYPEDFAVQISGASATTEVDEGVLRRAENALKEAGIPYRDPELGETNAMVRVETNEQQLRAKSVLQNALGNDYVVALNLAPTTPEWLTKIGAAPMKLGLDLRGGVHFLLEVDIPEALKLRLDVYSSELKQRMRDERIRYRSVDQQGERSLVMRFRQSEELAKAESLVRKDYPEFELSSQQRGEDMLLTLRLTDAKIREIEDYSVQQNLTTLRNRVNELGVAEPIVQRQGRNRIVVELPGVQDTAQAKRVIGQTANLEFRLEARMDAPRSSTVEYEFRNQPGRTAFLERDIIVTGNSVADASQGFGETGAPEVNITLDGRGGSAMSRVTSGAVHRRMAVVFVEHRLLDDGSQAGETAAAPRRIIDKKIISLATIQTTLGSKFRITGLNSVAEAQELALLLRAGALAAPIYFVEERTIGPSLGQQNIDAGILCIMIGFAFIAAWMFTQYHLFGLFANIALILNIVLMIALMSLFGATLTMPGIAGIVLTMGMAVDANVLINARIREEIKAGLPPQSAIRAGYDRAFTAIMDSNLTTLMVALILYSVGTGPIRGFAVTLGIGIVVSMFTAITVTRAMVNLVYGGRNVKKLSIGWIKRAQS